MANELPNAVALMRDSDFRDWVMAAAVYTARTVLAEPTATPDYSVRRQLAITILGNPSVIVERTVNIIAADPEVCSKGTTVTAVGQTLLIQKMADIWTPIAKLLYTP